MAVGIAKQGVGEVELLYEQESYQVRGAAFEVYREMGNGYVEPVYQECMERELQLRNAPFSAQSALKIEYKGQALNHRYIPDLICFDKIIVECRQKAIAGTPRPSHELLERFRSALGATHQLRTFSRRGDRKNRSLILRT